MLLEKTGSILGIPLNKQSRQILWQEILEVLEKPRNRCYSVLTPNPEILTHAYKNKNYADALRSADFSLVDGMGVIIVGRLSGQKFERFTGADLSRDLWQVAKLKHYKIAILDRHDGLSTKSDLENKLSELYLGVDFKIWQSDREQGDYEQMILEINQYQPDILFVSLGYPWQEHFLADYKNQLNCKLALGIGGSLDFIIGKQKRAPEIFRKLGFEWLYRWSAKPLKRSTRMVQALIVFPLLNVKYGIAKLFRLR